MRRRSWLLLAATLVAGPAWGAPPHPLDPLSVKEHWIVYDAVRASGRFGDEALFSAVRLNPPPKKEVLARGPGLPVRREAFVTLVDKGRTHEAIVDLVGEKLRSSRVVPDAHGPLTATETDDLKDLVTAHDEFKAALARRGIRDFTTLECWSATPGFFGGADERKRRLAQVYCFDRHGVFNYVPRPVEGLFALVDVTERKVLKVVDRGAVPSLRGPGDLDEESIGSARKVESPLATAQPAGPGFRVSGREVSWQRWRFNFRTEARRGVVVSLVRYEDGERERSILYEGGLSELFVPYMDPAPGWHNLTYLDLGDYGSSGLPRSLEPGAECPKHATFFDSVVADDHGLPQPLPRTACLFEREAGDVAWTHQVGTLVHARARRDLVLRWATTIGNYDYVFDWVFRQDGSLNGVVGSTGVVSVKGVEDRTAADRRPGRPAADAYGRFVAEHTVAVNHDHFFCFRLDLDVDGTENSFVFDRLKTQRLPDDNPRRSVWVVEPRAAERESQAKLGPHDGEGYWRFVNPRAIGPLGYPSSFELRPGHGASSLLLPEDYPQQRAAFTRHALWVTPQKDDEVYAAGEYTSQSASAGGLAGWTAADRPIANADIVAWYTIGMHHVVRAEDWPVMPAIYHSFELRPFDFFARNPALDLPRPR